MTEQPNDPRYSRPEGIAPPYAVVPLPVVPAPQPMPQPPPEVDGMYKDGIGFGLWMLFVFGLAGVHRIYLGKYGTGILWLLTWGLFGIGQFVDLFRMKALVREANVREGYLPHPRQMKQMGVGSAPAAARLPPHQNPQQILLKAAQTNGGALTVTQGVVSTGLTFEQVEEILSDMVAKGYVDVDNAPNSGVVVYRFPELGPIT